MANDQDNLEDIRIQLSLKIDGWGSFDLNRSVKLENIPGAWRIHGEATELPGIGVAKHEAVLNFLSTNYGSKRFEPKGVCSEFLRTLLERARPEQLEKTAKIILKELDEH